jgi:hypothetical protein
VIVDISPCNKEMAGNVSLLMSGYDQLVSIARCIVVIFCYICSSFNEQLSDGLLLLFKWKIRYLIYFA